MAEKISRTEGRLQMNALQSLMMEAYATELPEVGYLVHTDEPELLIEYLYRAKAKDPMLSDMVISLKSSGVAIYHDVTKDRMSKLNMSETEVESSRVKEDGEAGDSPPHLDL